MLTLEVKQLKYVSRMLETPKGDLTSPEYLRLNPRGNVPTLKDGDFVVSESLAIMVYLDRKYAEPPLFGKDEREAGAIWRVISEYTSYVLRVSTTIVKTLYAGKASEKQNEISELVPTLHAELDRLESTLRNSSWLATASLSAADIALYPFLKSLFRAAEKPEAEQFELGLLPVHVRYPLIHGWMQRMEQIPGYEKTYPPLWERPSGK